MKVLVNTISAKKQAGGAFQVSQNFLLRTLNCKEIDWCYFVSQDIDDAIGSHFFQYKDQNYFVFPTQPDFRRSYFRVKKQLSKIEDVLKPDVVYTITAPSYFSFQTPEVMRFTNPWVTHPNRYAWSVLSLREKVFYYLYGKNQIRMMKKAHFFVTQTETCAEGIRRITKEPQNHVKVVKNVLPAIFQTLDNSPISDSLFINIACVGAATTHKNFDIIPNVLKELVSNGYDNIRFHVTLPDDEPTFGVINNKAVKLGVNQMIVNHGRLTQSELGDLYRKSQFCFLPTLLEVFSASTLEAMYYGLPTVVTDFPFNKDVFEDSALYYKPMDAKSAADQFAELFRNIQLQEKLKNKMQNRLSLYGDYDAHFSSIVDFLKQVVIETR